MKRILHGFLLTCLLLFVLACSKGPIPGGDSSLDPTNPEQASLQLGVVGHPLNQEAYKRLSPSAQIALIKSLGMSIYRIGAAISPTTGKMNMHERYLELKHSADSAGVTILPMVPAKLDFNDTEAKSYQTGYERAYKYASVYKDDFIYYNIANELDNKCILPNKAGVLTSDYDATKFKIIAAHLKGMNDGIKAVDNNAQTMVNACWMHYQYLLMLEEYGVNFDIVAYHWYDDMEKLALKTYQITDITQFLSEKFTKPIWFTEVNIRNYKGTTADEVQKDFLNSFIVKCNNNPQVKALIIYELFNQPVFKNSESYYGLFDWVKPYTEYVPKLWAKEISNLNSPQ